MSVSPHVWVGLLVGSLACSSTPTFHTNTARATAAAQQSGVPRQAFSLAGVVSSAMSVEDTCALRGVGDGPFKACFVQCWGSATLTDSRFDCEEAALLASDMTMCMVGLLGSRAVCWRSGQSPLVTSEMVFGNSARGYAASIDGAVVCALGLNGIECAPSVAGRSSEVVSIPIRIEENLNQNRGFERVVVGQNLVCAASENVLSCVARRTIERAISAMEQASGGTVLTPAPAAGRGAAASLDDDGVRSFVFDQPLTDVGAWSGEVVVVAGGNLFWLRSLSEEPVPIAYPSDEGSVRILTRLSRRPCIATEDTVYCAPLEVSPLPMIEWNEWMRFDTESVVRLHAAGELVCAFGSEGSVLCRGDRSTSVTP